MTQNKIEVDNIAEEDLSIEFAPGPVNLPRLASAGLIFEFAKISQNASRLNKTLTDYWKHKNDAPRFPAGSEGRKNFDDIEAIVLQVAPSQKEGKPYPPVSLDQEAELRIISVACGMNFEGISAARIQSAFLPHKDVTQILDMGRQIEDLMDHEVVVLEDKDRPELSVIANLSAVPRSPRVKNKDLAGILRQYWRLRRDDYPKWPTLGPIYVQQARGDIENCLAFHLKAQYWRGEAGKELMKHKVAVFISELEQMLRGNVDLIVMTNYENGALVWSCGWTAAAELSGIRLPDRSDSEQLAEFSARFAGGEYLELLKSWILDQFESRTVDYIKNNGETTIDPTLLQFSELVKHAYAIVPGDPPAGDSAGPAIREEPEVNPFLN